VITIDERRTSRLGPAAAPRQPRPANAVPARVATALASIDLGSNHCRSLWSGGALQPTQRAQRVPAGANRGQPGHGAVSGGRVFGDGERRVAAVGPLPRPNRGRTSPRRGPARSGSGPRQVFGADDRAAVEVLTEATPLQAQALALAGASPLAA